MNRTPLKYDPLRVYLAAQSGDPVVLTFAAVEAIIGGSLPPTAQGPSFWRNRTYRNSPAYAWLAMGWRVASVNFGLRQVTFMRREVEP